MPPLLVFSYSIRYSPISGFKVTVETENMPRLAPRLNDRQVAKLAKEVGLHSVGGTQGLMLRVLSEESKNWVLRLRIGKVTHWEPLGTWWELTLAEARDKAADYRRKLKQGVDPNPGRTETSRLRNRKVINFRDAATAYIELKSPSWKSKKHKKQWETTLEEYANPVIGDKDLRDITVDHLLKILEPIWSEITETATRVRGRVERVIGWGIAEGYREESNPARWKENLEHKLTDPADIKEEEHYPSLPYAKIHPFIEDLRTRDGSAKALEFAILTATRSGDVRLAKWTEVDLRKRTWTIPARRLKGRKKKAHIVPLSDQAMAVLEHQSRGNIGDLIFPSRNKKGEEVPYSDMTLSKLIKDMDEQAGGNVYMDPDVDRIAVPHGFRSSFRTWAEEETDYAKSITETSLAHGNRDKVEAAYQRGDLRRKRGGVMQEWADYLDTPTKGDTQ